MPSLELIELVEAATVTTGGSSAPASGTIETWDFSGALPAIGANRQFRIMDEADRGNVSGYETMLATANASGVLTVTRGADGTTPKSHSSGFKIIPVVTPAALDNRYLDAENGGFTLGTVDFYDALTDANPVLSISPSGIQSAQSGSATPISAGAFNFVGNGIAPTLYIQDATGSTTGANLLELADHTGAPIAWFQNSGGFSIVDKIQSVNGVNSVPSMTFGRSGGTGNGWGLTLNTLAAPVVTPSLGSGGALSASTEYFYTVVPVRHDGAQGIGLEVHDTTTSGNKTIVLTWPHIGGAATYLVYRSTISGTYGSTALVGTVTDNAFSGSVTFSDNGITPATGSPNSAAMTGNAFGLMSTTDTLAEIGWDGTMRSYASLGITLGINPLPTTTDAGAVVLNAYGVASAMINADLVWKATVNVVAFGADNTFSPTNLTAAVATGAFHAAYEALPQITIPFFRASTGVWSTTTVPYGRFEIPSGGYNLDMSWHGSAHDFGPFVQVVCPGGRGSAVLYYTGAGNNIVIQATQPYNNGPQNVDDNPATSTSPQGSGLNPFWGFQHDTVAGCIKNIVVDGQLMTNPSGYAPIFNSLGTITNIPVAFMIACGESWDVDVTVRNWNHPTYGQGVGVCLQGSNSSGGVLGNAPGSWLESGHYKIFTVNCDVHVAFLGMSTQSRSFNDTTADIRMQASPGQMGVVIEGANLYHVHMKVNGGMHAQMPITLVTIASGQIYSPGNVIEAFSKYPIPAFYNGMLIKVGTLNGIIQGATEGGDFFPGFGYLFNIVPLTSTGAQASGTTTTLSATMVTVSPGGPPSYMTRNHAFALASLGINGGPTSGNPKIQSGNIEILMECNSGYLGGISTNAVLTGGTTYSTSNPIPIEDGGSVTQHGIIAGTSFTITGDPNATVFIAAANSPIGSTSVEVETVTLPSGAGNNIPAGGALNENILPAGIPGTIFIDDTGGALFDCWGHLDFAGGGLSYHGIRLTSGSFTGTTPPGFTFTGLVQGDATLSTSGAEVFLRMHTATTAPVGTPH